MPGGYPRIPALKYLQFLRHPITEISAGVDKEGSALRGAISG